MPDIAAVAALISDRARAAMLDALLDGRALTAKELACTAGIAAQTASGHLAKLRTAGLVRMEVQGRNRYFRLAGVEVAQALESLAVLSVHAPVHNRVAPRAPAAMREARTCYDHLAGWAGVAITAALVQQRLLQTQGRGYALTRKGARLTGRFGIDTAQLKRQRRAFALQCLDWTERKSHLAGALGAAFTQVYFDRGWIARREETRALTITPQGAKAFAEHFGVQIGGVRIGAAHPH